MKNKNIEFNRQKINSIDRRIVELLEQRMKCSVGIGKAKKAKNLPVTDQTREQTIVKNLCQKSDLNPDFLEELFHIAKFG